MRKDAVLDFSALYRQYARDVHRFALFLSGDGATADDIVSESLGRLIHFYELSNQPDKAATYRKLAAGR